jgi:methionyl-tRNA formyltransferase
MPPPRMALFVLEALPNARAVRRFVEEHAGEIAFVGLSNAERPNAGGLLGQTWRHLRRSGPGFLPYLAINFGLPDLLQGLHPLTTGLSRGARAATTVPLARLCKKLGIPTLYVDDVNGAEVAQAFARWKPELIVTFHFDQILSAATLALAPLGGLNVHPGLLPRHRGPVPTIHALAEEPPAFGVTVHRLVARIDAGAILAQEAVPLPPGTSATRAAILLHEHGRLLVDRVLATFAEGGRPEGRAAEALPYCPFPSPALLRSLRRRGRRLTTWRDLSDSLLLSAAHRKSSPDDLQA